MDRLILYGSCQVQQLARIFAASAEVRARFDVRVHWVGDQARLGHEWAKEIAEADVLMVQDVPERSAFDHGYWEQARGQVVTFPFLTLSALWPFDTAHGEADPVVAAAHAAGRGLKFQFQDKLLGQLRIHVPDKEARYVAYRSLSSRASEEIDRMIGSLDPPAHLARNCAALHRRDAAHGLSIGETIGSLCRSMPVFHSVSHPTLPIMHRLAGELLGKVGVSLEPDLVLSDGFAPLQVPVHPIVAHLLGLGWALERTHWNIHGDSLSFEQYYRHYIDVFG
jgi:hypothetical protein